MFVLEWDNPTWISQLQWNRSRDQYTPRQRQQGVNPELYFIINYACPEWLRQKACSVQRHNCALPAGESNSQWRQRKHREKESSSLIYVFDVATNNKDFFCFIFIYKSRVKRTHPLRGTGQKRARTVDWDAAKGEFDPIISPHSYIKKPKNLNIFKDPGFCLRCLNADGIGILLRVIKLWVFYWL